MAGGYKELFAQIDANIRRNGAQEITGPILNAVLRLMVTELGSGSVLMGVADAETQPGTPDGNVAYIAAPGTYPNFGDGMTVPPNSIGLFAIRDGAWTLRTVQAVQVDGELSDGSANPIQNRAVKSAIDGVEKKVTEGNTAIDGRLDTIEGKIDSLSEAADAIVEDMDGLATEIGKVNIRVAGNENALQELQIALGEVSDKTDGIQTDLTQAKADTAQLNRDLGVYDTAISLPMTVEKSGKYVDPDGQEKSSASMGISAPLEVKSGNIYLLQCAAAVGTGVALFARKVTNIFDKVIAYSYTYNGDGTIATATADYDPELVYSYSYNEEGVATITDKDGETVLELPATHQVTESFYEPLFRTNDATMPKSGYYLLLCTQDMEIVVSAASSDITGKNLLGVRYGVFASIATNFVGSPGQKVIAQAFAELYAAVQALSSVVDNAGHLKADVLDMANLPKVCGEDMYLTGEGAPAAPPTVPFQEYYDSENLKFYKAKGVLPDSPTTGDWVAIN